MSSGRRNDEMIELLRGDLLPRQEFYSDGARLISATLATHRAFDGTQGAGGNLIEGWLADSRQIHGTGSVTVWTENNISATDYLATTNGGPYVKMRGYTAPRQYLSIADATWQEAGTEEILTWRWVRLITHPAGADRYIIAKYNPVGNQASWRLGRIDATTRFVFITNATGNLVNDVTVTAATFGATVIDTWYFVAGYFKASTLMQIWVGRATDDILATDTLIVGVPAGVFNTTAPLTVGAIGTPTAYWPGYIGVGHTRFNVPSANVDAHVTRLFHLTRWFYQA